MRERQEGRETDRQTWLSLSGCFSTHILGRWTSDRVTDSWKPSGPMTPPGSTLTTALQSVLYGITHRKEKKGKQEEMDKVHE